MITSIRRSQYAFFYFEDDYAVDVASLLRGELPQPRSEPRVIALAIVTGQRKQLNQEELYLLRSVPAGRWMSAGDHDQEAVRALVDTGLLLSDDDDEPARSLRERDDALSQNAWNLYAALYHFMTQWSGVDTCRGETDERRIAAQDTAALKALVAEHGQPPGTFADPRPGRKVMLRGGDLTGGLYRALTSRRTNRAFDVNTPMTQDQLDTVLRYVFGCHGSAIGAGNLLCIKRTSPSGGGLHPVEAYPVVTNVAGIPSGIYQYGVRDHTLTMLMDLDPWEARQLAGSFMCGQNYFGRAHVSFILSARFYRNHWKYRSHPKSYAAIFMDAAHLTQTLYLVSHDLGLGAFVTLAINNSDIEEYLSFDGVSEGVIAMAGCGVKASGDSPLELQFSA